MFLIASVTVAVRWTLSWASETSFSYSQHLRVDHHPPLGAEGEVDGHEGGLVVVEPLDPLGLDHVEVAEDLEDVLGLHLAGPAGDDDPLRVQVLDELDRRPEGVGLGAGGLVRRLGGGVVRLDRHHLILEVVEGDLGQCGRDRLLDIPRVVGDRDGQGVVRLHGSRCLAGARASWGRFAPSGGRPDASSRANRVPSRRRAVGRAPKFVATGEIATIDEEGSIGSNSRPDIPPEARLPAIPGRSDARGWRAGLDGQERARASEPIRLVGLDFPHHSGSGAGARLAVNRGPAGHRPPRPVAFAPRPLLGPAPGGVSADEYLRADARQAEHRRAGHARAGDSTQAGQPVRPGRRRPGDQPERRRELPRRRPRPPDRLAVRLPRPFPAQARADGPGLGRPDPRLPAGAGLRPLAEAQGAPVRRRRPDGRAARLGAIRRGRRPSGPGPGPGEPDDARLRVRRPALDA